VLREETATVLPFRDAALRRPIDVVAWMNTHAPRAGEPATCDNVIPLARFDRASRRVDRRVDRWPWLDGPPEGDAA
jgi:hypothetical protein